MPWVRMDDAFLDHPKLLDAGPLAGYLWLTSIAWSNRNLRDGFVPQGQVIRLVDFRGYSHDGEEAQAEELAKRLVKVGLWEKRPGGYYIHDYTDYQFTAEEIKRRSTLKSAAGKKGAQARWGSKSMADAMASAKGDGWQTDGSGVGVGVGTGQVKEEVEAKVSERNGAAP